MERGNALKKSNGIAASLQRSGIILLGAFFVVFAYTTLHESGHALAALLCGGTVSQISVNFLDLSAHVVIDGSFTSAQGALIAVSGWALPVLVTLAFMLLGRAVREPLLMMLRWISGISVLGSTLPWVVLPLIYLGGERPADDVTNFLDRSGLPPLLVALGFAALVAGGVGLIVTGRKQVPELREWLRGAEAPLASPATRRTLAVMLLLTAVLAGGLLLVNGSAPAGGVPAEYRWVAQTDLSQADPAGVVIYAFDKAEAGPFGIYLLARNVRTDFVDVTLTGPDGWSFTVLHGEDYSATEERLNPAWGELPAGHYELVLTGSPARGEIAVYVTP